MVCWLAADLESNARAKGRLRRQSDDCTSTWRRGPLDRPGVPQHGDGRTMLRLDARELDCIGQCIWTCCRCGRGGMSGTPDQTSNQTNNGTPDATPPPFPTMGLHHAMHPNASPSGALIHLVAVQNQQPPIDRALYVLSAPRFITALHCTALHCTLRTCTVLHEGTLRTCTVLHEGITDPRSLSTPLRRWWRCPST